MKLHNSIVITLVLCLGFGGTAFGYDFEHNGVYYEFVGEPHTATQVRIVAPPEGKYRGTFELIPKIPYNGNIYDLSTSGLYTHGAAGILDGSEIEEFIVGEGWDKKDMPQVGLTQNPYLKKITLKSLVGLDDVEKGWGLNFINLGDQTGCVDMYMRQTGELQYDLIVNKFEVYGPDGERLVPYVEDPIDGEFNYTPLEYGVPFRLNTLDPTTIHSGNYFVMLKVSSYFVVELFSKIGDAIKYIRVEPHLYQSGQYVKIDGVDYAVQHDHAAAYLPLGKTYSGDVKLAEHVTYNGKNYMVKNIEYSAFSGTDITGVVFPWTITNVSQVAFSGCPNLKSVDMSACDNIESFSRNSFSSNAFSNCTSLIDVKLPYAQTHLGNLFSNCTSLEEIEIPETITEIYNTFSNCKSLRNFRVPRNAAITNPFDGCDNLISIEKLVDNDTELKFKVTHHLMDTDGNPLPIVAIPGHYYTSGTQYSITVKDIFTPDENGVYTMPKECFHLKFNYYDYNGQERVYDMTSQRVILAYGDDGSDYLPATKVGDTAVSSSFSTFYYSQLAGVEDVKTDSLTETDNAEPVYYTLQGIRVAPNALTPGLYIRRTGNKAEKIIIR